MTRLSTCCSPMAEARPRWRERRPPLSCFGRPRHSLCRSALHHQPPLTSGRHRCGLHRPRSRDSDNNLLLMSSPSFAQSRWRHVGRRQTAAGPRGSGDCPSAWGRAVSHQAEPRRTVEFTRWRHTCTRSVTRRAPRQCSAAGPYIVCFKLMPFPGWLAQIAVAHLADRAVGMRGAWEQTDDPQQLLKCRLLERELSRRREYT